MLKGPRTKLLALKSGALVLWDWKPLTWFVVSLDPTTLYRPCLCSEPSLCRYQAAGRPFSVRGDISPYRYSDLGCLTCSWCPVLLPLLIQMIVTEVTSFSCCHPEVSEAHRGKNNNGALEFATDSEEP